MKIIRLYRVGKTIYVTRKNSCNSRDNGSEVAIKAGLDVAMTLIGTFGGPIGFGVSALYFIADYATDDGFGGYGSTY